MKDGQDEADPPLYEPFAVQEIPLDGFFDDAHIHEGSFRCTAFSMQSLPGGGKQVHPVAVIRLSMTLRAARHFADLIKELLAEQGASTRSSKSQRRRV